MTCDSCGEALVYVPESHIPAHWACPTDAEDCTSVWAADVGEPEAQS